MKDLMAKIKFLIIHMQGLENSTLMLDFSPLAWRVIGDQHEKYTINHRIFPHDIVEKTVINAQNSSPTSYVLHGY